MKKGSEGESGNEDNGIKRKEHTIIFNSLNIAKSRPSLVTISSLRHHLPPNVAWAFHFYHTGKSHTIPNVINKRETFKIYLRFLVHPTEDPLSHP
jgi:hypothetical protein